MWAGWRADQNYLLVYGKNSLSSTSDLVATLIEKSEPDSRLIHLSMQSYVENPKSNAT
jgi:hypothetical protein